MKLGCKDNANREQKQILFDFAEVQLIFALKKAKIMIIGRLRKRADVFQIREGEFLFREGIFKFCLRVWLASHWQVDDRTKARAS